MEALTKLEDDKGRKVSSTCPLQIACHVFCVASNIAVVNEGTDDGLCVPLYRK